MLDTVIATKIQNIHDLDPDAYPFQDWGSPTGKEVSQIDLHLYS